MHSKEIVDFDGPTLLALWEFRIGRYDVDDMNLVCVSLEDNFQTYQIPSSITSCTTCVTISPHAQPSDSRRLPANISASSRFVLGFFRC